MPRQVRAQIFGLSAFDALGHAHVQHGMVDYPAFAITSLHFMGREAALTPGGQERLGLCVFHVPIGGRLVPMCEASTLGTREQHYEPAEPFTTELKDPAWPAVSSG